MAWSAPATAVSNSLLTASWLNTYLRDNMLETTPAKATEAGQMFTTSSPNVISATSNSIGYVGTSQSTTSTTYTDLATVGPSITITMDAFVIIRISADLSSNNSSAEAFMSFAVSGATTVAASTTRAVGIVGTRNRKMTAYVALDGTTINSGVNTFTAKYRSNTAGTATFSDREISAVVL